MFRRLFLCGKAYKCDKERNEWGRHMELKSYRDSLRSMNTVNTIKIEVPIETEILIPDYLPPVFKIVKTLVHRVVLQKQIQNGCLLIEGYFRLEVFYQSDEQKLCTTEQKNAFSRQIDLKNMEDIKGSSIDVSGEIQYINCRAINQRRLDLRGAYHLSVHLMVEYERSVITALSECGVQQKQISLPAVLVRSSREKQFNTEIEISFAQPPEQVLHTHTAAHIQEVRIVAGKAVVKGELCSQIVYTESRSGQLLRQEAVLPFNQVVEIDGAVEGAECQADVEPIGCTISRRSDSEQTVLCCTGLLTVRAFNRMEYNAVKDCFSTEYSTEVSTTDAVTETLLETLSNVMEVHLEGELPGSDLEIIDCFADCSVPELFEENGNTAVRGRITAHILCRDPMGEIDCYDKSAEYLLPKRYSIPACDISAGLNAGVENIRYSANQGRAEANISVRISGFLCCKNTDSIVDSVVCGDILEKDESIALRVYYAAEGEEVFHIAKRYHASPRMICSLAGITGETLTKDMKLLIPQV